MFQNPVFPMIREVKETRDVREMAEILAKGNWVVFFAVVTESGDMLFSLGRVC